MEQSDPRVLFAAERTLLAWLRTGLTVIGLGFIISRFGLFIQLLASQPLAQQTNATISVIFGIGFVIIGSLAIAMAAIQHKRFVRSLTPEQLSTAYSNTFAFTMSMFVAMLGIALAIYLWLT